jgi:mono/diheme cytochrome c family protein
MQGRIRNLVATGIVVLAVLAISTFSTVTVQAQSIRVDVPYPFIVGSTTLPAGTYTLSSSANSLRIVLRSESGPQITQLIITRLGGPSEFLQEGSMVFERSEKGRVLSEVWMPGSDGLLLHSISKGSARDVLSFSSLSETKPVSGKVAFSLTCARCHGSDGKGNEKADKFFGMRIQRLNSPEIQSRQDVELKEIINSGRSSMPPVEVDESGFRHRLPAQDVDAVIAYIRTLKP